MLGNRKVLVAAFVLLLGGGTFAACSPWTIGGAPGGKPTPNALRQVPRPAHPSAAQVAAHRNIYEVFTSSRQMLDPATGKPLAAPETETHVVNVPTINGQPVHRASTTNWQTFSGHENGSWTGYALFKAQFTQGRDCDFWGNCWFELQYNHQATALWDGWHPGPLGACGTVGIGNVAKYGIYGGGSWWVPAQGLWPAEKTNWPQGNCTYGLAFYGDSAGATMSGGFTAYATMGINMFIGSLGSMDWYGQSNWGGACCNTWSG